MNLELSANYALNVILVKQLRAPPGLPSLQQSLRPLPRALAKMQFFFVLGENLPTQGPRETDSYRGSIPDRGLCKQYGGLTPPGHPWVCAGNRNSGPR